MQKEDIFSKINIKDYNNSLEKILEKKKFSEDVKNLLLSMLYKIENAYEDYETVKINVCSKKEYVEKILKIIDEKCNQIQLVKPMTQESKELETKKVNFLVDEENGKIKVYQNEKMILDAILKMIQKDTIIEDKYFLLNTSFSEFLKIGSQINNSEVIRDFNGWSWDVLTKEIENINYNIIYQNIIILLGNRFIYDWANRNKQDNSIEENNTEIPNYQAVNNIIGNKIEDNFEIYKDTSKLDYLETMKILFKQIYGKNLKNEFIENLSKILISICINNNEKEKQKLLEEKQKQEQLLDLMNNKRKYIEYQSKNKKEISEKIRRIDTLLNNDELLRTEYTEINSTLENKDKIFSVSHLADRLEKERKLHLEEIKQINKSIDPTEFVSIKNEVEKEVEFFNDIGIEENVKSDEEKHIANLQKTFIKCFKLRIKNVENKKEIITLLYELRYYMLLPISREKCIKDLEPIQEELIQLQKDLIQKACENKILIKTSDDKELNYNILSTLFKEKIIKLESIVIILKYNKDILSIEIYDGNIHENTQQVKIKQKTELVVKLNKKIKIFG